MEMERVKCHNVPKSDVGTSVGLVRLVDVEELKVVSLALGELTGRVQLPGREGGREVDSNGVQTGTIVCHPLPPNHTSLVPRLPSLFGEKAGKPGGETIIILRSTL